MTTSLKCYPGKSVLITRARSLRKNPTKAEALLWQLLRGGQVGARFRRQHPLGSWIVDFYCPALRLVVELRFDPTWETERDKVLRAAGYRVLRLAGHLACDDPERALQLVREAVEV